MLPVVFVDSARHQLRRASLLRFRDIACRSQYPSRPCRAPLLNRCQPHRTYHDDCFRVRPLVRINLPVVAFLGGASWERGANATCETVVLRESIEVAPIAVLQEPSGWKKLRRKILKTFRLWKRFLKLMLTLTPVVALYPIQFLSSSKKDERDAHEAVLDTKKVEGPLGWYLAMCLYCVEWSGAAVIKLMQWAGSRPDLFGHDFCAVFSRLQDDTTPHSWRHTEQAMREAYGNDWKDRIDIDPEVLGSGCIGQVYRGVVKDGNGREQEVAVKVLHPNVEEDIDCDIELMRIAAKFLQWAQAFPGIKYMNLEGVIDEFASLLKLQLDLRNEAAHLVRFHENFAEEKDVIFPQLVDGYEPTKDVLIESFCDGVPVLQFARENRDNKKLLREMCEIGIRAICKMIFVDNFLHGDLHPGNVFVSPDHKFVVLDFGMVTEFSEADHRLIVEILTSFIRQNGRRAGELMIDDSNVRNTDDQALREEQYIEKIEWITTRANLTQDYLMARLGSYITEICNAAALHHVMMNPAFVSAALAVKIQEGIALALDPSVQIFRIANPIILRSEFDRKVADVFTRVREAVGLE